MDTHWLSQKLSRKRAIRLVALRGALFSVTEQGASVAFPLIPSQLSMAQSLSELCVAEIPLAANPQTNMNFESLDDSDVNVHNLTTFVNDNIAKTAHKREQIPLLSSVLDSARITQEQDIKDFLARPVVLQDGLFQSTDTVTIFPIIPLLDTILTGPMVAPKLVGFGGIRADVVLTLQINATRFTQGRYLLNFYPTGGAMDIAHSNQAIDLARFSLVQRTSVPGIQIDLNTETQVQLRIPFMSAYAFNSLRSATTGVFIRNIGSAQIHPYVAASTACTYTLFGHLENVELYLPTAPQANTKTVTEKEQSSKDIGPVESTAKLISKTSKLFKNVPILSSYVEPIGWAADLVGGAASAFGWSKPTISDTITVLARNRGYQNPNYDGADMAVKMSLSVKNQVATVPGLGSTDIDEMSFDYIKTIPAYFNSTTWSTGTAKEVLLATLPLSPQAFGLNLIDNGNSTLNYPPCCSPELYFNLYRGSFKITIKAVKTEFHSGRLSVAYVPQPTNGLSNPSVIYPSTYFVNRHIIDVRTAKEWTFEFPFGSDFTYLDTNVPYGNVFIYIENPLVAPPTVPSTIDLIFEVSGGEDLEYAMPKTMPYATYHPSAPQADTETPGLVSLSTDPLDTTVGSTAVGRETVNFAEISIGEKFNSFRQLIKRMDMRGRATATPNAAGQYTIILPFARELVEGIGTAGAPTYPFTQPDTFSLVSNMFAIARGSVRIKLYDPTPSASGACFAFVTPIGSSKTNQVTYGTTDSSGRVGPAGAMGSLSAQVPISDGLTAEVQIPMYVGAFGFSNADTNISPTVLYPAINSSAPSYALNITQMSPVLASPNAPFTLRGAGDDFSLHCFVCVPPVIAVATKYSAAGWT